MDKNLHMDITSLGLNLGIAALVAIMVFLMPWIDRHLSARLGLNLQGGISQGAHAKQLNRLRQFVLFAVFGVYLAAVSYVVFFSRAAAEEYRVQAKLFNGLDKIDFGILTLPSSLVEEGLEETVRQVRAKAAHIIAELYLNVMLFVPMGYLLPYVFKWFRRKVYVRPVVASFLISLAIENTQLLTKRGFYDVDDLIGNTLGGFIGQWLYVFFAYVVTHPDWRKDLKALRRWRRMAKNRTLYPFVRRLGVARTTILATDEEAVFSFYINKLGCRLLKQTLPEGTDATEFLLQLGRSPIEIRCSNTAETLHRQYLTISVRRIEPVKKRLEQNGIETSDIEADAYTGYRCLHFSGPDDVLITIIEE